MTFQQIQLFLTFTILNVLFYFIKEYFDIGDTFFGGCYNRCIKIR